MTAKFILLKQSLKTKPVKKKKKILYIFIVTVQNAVFVKIKICGIFIIFSVIANFLSSLQLWIIYNWFHENGSFSVHSFIVHYLSIPEYTVRWGNCFQETHGM